MLALAPKDGHCFEGKKKTEVVVEQVLFWTLSKSYLSGRLKVDDRQATRFFFLLFSLGLGQGIDKNQESSPRLPSSPIPPRHVPLPLFTKQS